jgi:hypothetical protein
MTTKQDTKLSALVAGLPERSESRRDLDYLEAAEQLAPTLLTGGVTLADAVLDSAERLALQVQGEWVQKAEAKLAELDKAWPEHPSAVDEACNRWSPVVTSAFYLGLAMGYGFGRGQR